MKAHTLSTQPRNTLGSIRNRNISHSTEKEEGHVVDGEEEDGRLSVWAEERGAEVAWRGATPSRRIAPN